MQLRPYQRAAIDALHAYFGMHDGNPLIVLPTGSGKSVVIAEFIRGALQQWPQTRVLMLTHVKELIEQNLDRLTQLWPGAPVGVYSASLRKRDVYDPVIFAGIQSVHRKAQVLGRFDLVIVDEAHLINASGTGMYRRLLDDLRAINPALKVVGLTATAFRTSTGDITHGDDRIFDGIAYELPMSTLLDHGHLAPLVSKRMAAEFDVSQVAIRQGEFVAAELEAAVDRDDITQAAVSEIIERGAARRSWLLFCAGVAHAEHVCAALQARGIAAACVTGGTPKPEREQIIKSYQRGELRAVTNANVLTTGFDAPATDLLAFLRPTCSPGLYVQMAGRGMRTAPGKANCLVLDFAGNVLRHGPVDAVRPWVPKKRGQREGAAPVRTCPDCDTISPAQARRCPECGYEWPEKPKHEASASDAAIMTSQKERELVEARVDEVVYLRHEKRGKPPSMRVDYLCGVKVYSEWVCVQHTGYARAKAVAWWWERDQNKAIPTNVDEAIARAEKLPKPGAITVDVTDQYPEIKHYDFTSKPAGLPDATAEGEDACGPGELAEAGGADDDIYALF